MVTIVLSRVACTRWYVWYLSENISISATCDNLQTAFYL
jgi:hypothetical protein